MPDIDRVAEALGRWGSWHDKDDVVKVVALLNELHSEDRLAISALYTYALVKAGVACEGPAAEALGSLFELMAQRLVRVKAEDAAAGEA